ncbi:MAG: glycosyltransferase [Acinetobacter sp.]
MKLSLIIPVYNVEKYIEQCLRSLCTQLPYAGVEVIVVNDGTPDQSMVLIENFLAMQDEQIRQHFLILHQHNQGLSAARNTGIAHAKGDYLAFLDSDDYLQPNYFATLFSALQANPDIIQFSAQRVTDTGEIIPFLSPMPVEGLQHLNTSLLLELSHRSAWFVWLRVYRRELFAEIYFPLATLYEDAYTTPFLFLKAKTVYFSPNILLNYRVNPRGITATKSKKSIDDLGGAAVLLLSHVAEYPILVPTVVSISQSYIYDSLMAEGVLQAQQRWTLLKRQLQQHQIDPSHIRNRGNRLFWQFGVLFLLVDRGLRRVGWKK